MLRISLFASTIAMILMSGCATSRPELDVCSADFADPKICEMDQSIIIPHTTCGVLCTVSPAGDDDCKSECGGKAICQQAKCDLCGGICIFLTAQP